ncbi:MAG TPA: thiamine diphosphokinase [Acidobacteriota bacterium]|nr:thiamine diphosphokinase [Acidobacteriota bacterium]
MRDCIIFLRGVYRARDLTFYRSLCRGKFRIAADGGYAFFRKSGLVPDLLVGDFDSLRISPNRLSSRTRIEPHSTNKNATDAELALDYCLRRGARRVDIVQPSIGEPDHFAGNLLLLARSHKDANRRYKPRVRLVDAAAEVLMVDSSVWIIRGAVGDRVSVVPISKRAILTCQGTDYDVVNLTIRRGETVGLRNRVRTARARFEIRGTALVFHRWAGR